VITLTFADLTPPAGHTVAYTVLVFDGDENPVLATDTWTWNAGAKTITFVNTSIDLTGYSVKVVATFSDATPTVVDTTTSDAETVTAPAVKSNPTVTITEGQSQFSVSVQDDDSEGVIGYIVRYVEKTTGGDYDTCPDAAAWAAIQSPTEQSISGTSGTITVATSGFGYWVAIIPIPDTANGFVLGDDFEWVIYSVLVNVS